MNITDKKCIEDRKYTSVHSNSTSRIIHFSCNSRVLLNCMKIAVKNAFYDQKYRCMSALASQEI